MIICISGFIIGERYAKISYKSDGEQTKVLSEILLVNIINKTMA